jgi:hypothetical protein
MENKKQFLMAGSLAVIMTALTVTGCGGAKVAASAQGTAKTQGSASGQWTKADVSKFRAASGAAAGDTQESCIIGYFEQDMSFGNAIAVTSVDPASASMSAAQIKTALVSKYGTAQGGTINAQLDRVLTDSTTNCSGSSAAATPAATPAATSEASCSVDCTDPVASGESGWLAQVQGALENVQQDLATISSDASGNPEDLTLDGSQLMGDAQATLDPNYDPPPADNADWTTAMNDYVTAGEDYSDQNMNEQDNTPAQASQEIAAGNAALAQFNAANGGVLNGTIQS